MRIKTLSISLSAVFLSTLMLTSCGEHSDYDVINFTGEYRYYSGIAEFFDCKSRIKYYVARAGADKDLEKAYLKLGMDEKDDVFIKVKGYLKEEKAEMDGINPATVFVPVEIVSLDKKRGCERGIRQGQ